MQIVLFLRTPLHRLIVRGRSRLTFGLLWTLPLTTALAEEAPAGKTSRLGFKFDPEAHAAAEAKRRAGATLAADAPPDSVIRLPKHVVTADRIPLDENDVLTPEGRVELAKKRYLSPMYQKTLGPLLAVAAFVNNVIGGWNPNGREATVLSEQDEKLRREGRIQELTELAELADSDRETEAKPPAGDAKTTKAKTR